jgi:MOSC domain-containing protein YiiM
MWKGTVVAIHIAPAARAPTVALEEVHAVPGQGLEGDRYFKRAGTYSRHPGSGRQITLIESEAVEALEQEYGVALGSGESRRNLVTRGVPLNHLVNREFRVGSVTLRGTRLCEPCLHLERLTARKGTRRGLVHRGGLRADILTDGVIRVGDAIQED